VLELPKLTVQESALHVQEIRILNPLSRKSLTGSSSFSYGQRTRDFLYSLLPRPVARAIRETA